MKETIFREYDIRGKVGTELIVEDVYDLTCAIAYYYKQQVPDIKTIAVGMDGRVHSAVIKEELSRALQDSGLNVLSVGVCSSPALYFAVHTMAVEGGLMVTASHNGKEYNGIKMCLGARPLWGTDIQAIHDLYKKKSRLIASQKGMVTEYAIGKPYSDWLVEQFAHLKNISLSAVIDCGNGATGDIMKELVKSMSWTQVQLLYADIDGTYPHHEADPTVEENMKDVKDLLATSTISVGIGLDGDGDRMAAMTKNGFLVPGDQLLALFAQPILKNYPGSSIVFDIKSSGGLSELIQKWGGVPIMSPSGHAIIKEYMVNHKALVAGELSCHFVFKDRYFGYDDGIYALLRLFELLHESGKALEELISVFPRKYSSREFRLFCEDTKKQAIVQAITGALLHKKDVQLVTIDGVRASMAYGWGIIRPSNTQPALSMRFEGDSFDGLQRVKKDFIDLLQPYMPDTNLKVALSE